jgi:hypothetical protein
VRILHVRGLSEWAYRPRFTLRYFVGLCELLPDEIKGAFQFQLELGAFG